MTLSASNTALMTHPVSEIVGNHPVVLREVVTPGVNLGLWQRPTQGEIIRELSGLKAEQLPSLRCPTSRETFDDDLLALLQHLALDPAAFEHLRGDLHRLAGLFFDVCGDREVAFRLVATSGDDCRRFHVDRKHLRLLCTYRGPGTEWLAEAQVDRVAQRSFAPNESIIRFGKPAHFAPFWVGIMKGDPDNTGEGLVHRSPPIAGSGQVRILFSMDC